MMRPAVWMSMGVALVVAGCREPAGDRGVLATVGNQKITVAQLDTELRAGNVAGAENPKVRKAALDQIVARKLLALAAREGKLDAAPEISVMKAAGVEAFEAGLQQRVILEKVARPKPAEVASFIQAHPEMFAQRTGYLIDQLHVAVKADTALRSALQPAMTLEDAERVLQARAVPFTRTVEQLDTLRANPQLSAAIGKLRPGEPFVLPEPGGLTVSRVRESKVKPVDGPQATTLATEILLAQNRSKAIGDWVEAQKATKVVYAKALAPPKADR